MLVATAVQNVPANAVVVQRIKNDGQILWGAAGAGFATGNNNCDYRMRVVQGDSASMIMLWGDLEHRLQRVDTSGNFRWGPQGVVVGAAADCYALRRLCSDGAGGAYTLTLPQNTNQPEAFLQRVLANGTLAWPVPGVALGETGFSIGDMDLSADGSGGAFVITRLNSSFELRVRVQHVNAQGEVTNTVLLYSGGIQAGVNCALGTAVNGVVPAVWYLHPPGNRLGKFQRIATNGSMQWPASIDIYDSGGSPQSMNDLKILSHADGAQTFSWFDTRYASPTSKVYAHHVTADQSAGIADLVPAERFAHPVPTSDQLLIDLPGEAGSEWQLRTAAGAVVASGRLGSGAGSIDLGHVTNGCYVLNVRTSIGQRTQRVVVAR
ncbi:MAG: T9SS type A sorting domain-containing protein [Flavobacteriales bacterium]|nr:T9SS type A sorting domain-containing protein [Flavobacteriales bacterium]